MRISWTQWRNVGFKKIRKTSRPWSTTRNRVLLQDPQRCRLTKKFTAFYGSRRSVTVFTGPCHLSLSWARWNQSTSSHLVSLWCTLVLYSHPWLVLPCGLFPSGLLTKPRHAPLLPPCVLYAPPISSLRFDYHNNIWSWVGPTYHEISTTLFSPSFHSFLHLWPTHLFLSTVLSKTINMTGQISLLRQRSSNIAVS